MKDGLDRARQAVIATAIEHGHDKVIGELVADKLLTRLGEADFIRIYDFDSILQRRVRASRYVEVC